MTQEFRRFEYSTPWESFPNFRPKDETEAEAPVPQVESGEKKWWTIKLTLELNTLPLHVNKTILTMMLVLLFPMPGQAIILQNNLDQMNFICISSCVLLNDQDFLLTSMIFQLGEFTVFTLGVFCCFFLFSHYVLSVLLAVLSINKTSTHSL